MADMDYPIYFKAGVGAPARRVRIVAAGATLRIGDGRTEGSQDPLTLIPTEAKQTIDEQFVAALELPALRTVVLLPRAAEAEGNAALKFATVIGSVPGALVKPAIIDSQTGKALYSHDVVVLRTAAPTASTFWQALALQVPYDLARTLPYASHAHVLRPTTPSFQAAHALAEACRALDPTAIVYPVLSEKAVERSPARMPEEWHLGMPGLAAALGDGGDVHRAWNLGYQGKGVRIAHIERRSPAETSHSQLKGAFVAARDVTFDPNPVSDNLRRPCGTDTRHATMVAGLAGARGRSITLSSPIDNRDRYSAVGVAPQSSLIAILDAGGLGSLGEADAFYLAASVLQADVISCSWGPDLNPGFPHTLPPHVEWAMDWAKHHGRAHLGCPVLFAAGNERVPRPAGLSAGLSGYARHQAVTIVGACSAYGTLTSYSVPGEEVWAVFPMGDRHPQAAGESVVNLWSLDLTGRLGLHAPLGTNPSPDIRHDYAYLDIEGQTSGACAAMSGVVALVLEACPGLSAAAVRGALRAASQALPCGSQAGSRDDNFGHGRISAYRAVLAARQACRGQSEERSLA